MLLPSLVVVPFGCHIIDNNFLVFSIFHVYLFYCFDKFSFNVGLHFAWDSLSRSHFGPRGSLLIICYFLFMVYPIKL